MIKVSIIVPVYNTEKYLEECLKSVVNQTLKENEVIIINDGSTDNSLEIIKRYQDLYSNILVINQKNKGQSFARNKGLEKARGEYVGFVDSDDRIDINMYKYLYYYAKRESADIVEGDFKLTNCREISYTSFKGKSMILFNKYNNIQALKNFFKTYNTSVCTGIYKRSLFKNIKFPVGKIYEDIYCKPKLIFSANCLIKLQSTFYFCNERKGSTTRKNFEKDNFDMILTARKIISYLFLKDKIHFFLYSRNAVELLVHYVYYAIEKSIHDKYFEHRNELPKELSFKYISFILFIGAVFYPNKYIYRFWEIYNYFINLLFTRNIKVQ